MQALLGLLVLAGAFVLGAWWQHRRERRKQIRPWQCQCGGMLAHHNPRTGQCAHVEHRTRMDGLPYVLPCTCQRFVNAADPFAPLPPGYHDLAA